MRGILLLARTVRLYGKIRVFFLGMLREILLGSLVQDPLLMNQWNELSNSTHLPRGIAVMPAKGTAPRRREECDVCHALFFLRDIRFDGRRFLCSTCEALEARRQAGTASDLRIQS